MKKKSSTGLFLFAAICLLSGCSIFKPGCGCPKVVAARPVFHQPVKAS